MTNIEERYKDKDLIRPIEDILMIIAYYADVNELDKDEVLDVVVSALGYAIEGSKITPDKSLVMH